ncbi:carboxypeptidase-like regulatory domain-containing protein [Mucilaginibacter calamicampi]|uniref:Carboxypeptidase-like regulatory domain-containing protein n=1 Tax=Mucilaginibacter calamicampi TaxID=1302352 RepID=A0ABW2YU84_9SPHI
MKRIFSAFLILILSISLAHAQKISGWVKDAKTGETLPYVNIGVIGRAVGTVSNDAGKYSITLNNNADDSLRFSMIGYKPQAYVIKELATRQGDLNISLVPDVKQLGEVKVTNRKWKTGVLGNTTKSQSTSAGFHDNQLGHEIGIIIKTKRSPTWLKRFNASIVKNDLDSVIMRLNVYSVKDGMPDKNLLHDNIFVTVKKGQKAIDVDLTPYNIMVEDKFFIGLEWIKTEPGHGLMFSAALFFASPIISRETSQAAWEKLGIAGVGFNVTAEY